MPLDFHKTCQLSLSEMIAFELTLVLVTILLVDLNFSFDHFLRVLAVCEFQNMSSTAATLESKIL